MREDGGWPRNRWELSAPESHALLYGPKGKPGQALKLAVLELVARRTLALVEVEEARFFGTRRTAVLAWGERRNGPESRPLAAVLNLYRQLQQITFPNAGVTGVTVAELAYAVSAYYRPRGGFTEGAVMPALAARGMYRREGYRVLWIFPAARWMLTPTGEAARAELESTARLGERNFREWVDREPSRALAFLGVAGSSILLMDSLHPDLQRLREEEATGYVGGAYTGYTGGDPGTGDTLEDDASGTEVGDPGTFDTGALDFGTLDLDLGALGDLGGAFDSIDTGVDSGGGGGDIGGGGGGGDGGGGGGNGGGGGG